MIEFLSETDFSLDENQKYASWIQKIIEFEGFSSGDITYVFCDDNYLYNLNVEFLNHDTLTDIISFDYTIGTRIHGEIYISVERVRENAKLFQVPFPDELKRVIIHGILHFLGYKDKTEAEQRFMRKKENQCIALFPN